MIVGPFLLPQTRSTGYSDAVSLLAPGYSFAYMNGKVYSASKAKQNSSPITNYTTMTYGAYGKHMLSNYNNLAEASTTPLVRPPANLINSGVNRTIHCLFRSPGLSSANCLMGYSSRWAIVVSSGSVTVYLDTSGYGSPGFTTTVSYAFSTNKWYLVSLTFDSSNNVSLYVNGILAGSVNVTYTITGTDQNQLFQFGTGFINSNSYTGGPPEIAFAAVCERVQTAGEILALVSNPGRVFASPAKNTLCLINTNGVVTAPFSDVVVTGWTATPGPGYASMINEFVENDSNYITSPLAGTGNPITMTLGSPLPAGSWNIRFAAQYVGSFASSIQVSLLDSGNSVVGTTVAEVLTTTLDQHLLAIETTGIATQIQLSAL
ncbi:MAG TPA: LamG-like jellyroll fold domain-containing protein [Methanosarcina sp.]|nr:LamG-like jellyroll fold domain-containing protein [Methanosarcina sp.]